MCLVLPSLNVHAEEGNIFDKIDAAVKNTVGDVKTSSENAANKAINEADKGVNHVENEADKIHRNDEEDCNS